MITLFHSQGSFCAIADVFTLGCPRGGYGRGRGGQCLGWRRGEYLRGRWGV